MLPVWSKSLKQPYPNISTIESERHARCILSPLAQHSNKSERFGSQASSPKVAFPVSSPTKACSSSILLSSSWWRLRVHAFLSDRELSIHSHRLGLLVKLTERFCNQSVNVENSHTPISPMMEKRVLLGFHLEFCLSRFHVSNTHDKWSPLVCAIPTMIIMDFIYFSSLTLIEKVKKGEKNRNLGLLVIVFALYTCRPTQP